jgi:hypothetical protein
MICSLADVTCRICGHNANFSCPIHGHSQPVLISRDGTGIYCAQVVEETTDTCMMRLTAACPNCEN